MTTFRDGTKEEGKYKNNVLITSQKKKHLFLIRSAKFRERIDAAVDSAQRASKYALQKADIAISRTATARGKAELADSAADHARVDSDIAISTAREFAPDFKPSLLERFERIRVRERYRPVPEDPGPAITKPVKPGAEQFSPSHVANNSFSPTKVNINQMQQQQQAQLMAPQPSVRRTSVNPASKPPSLDYQNMNSNMYNIQSNSSEYGGNSLGLNQQFGQPQPPGSNAMYNSPQRPAASQAYSHIQQPNINVQQPQQNQNQMYNNINSQQLNYNQSINYSKPQNIDSYNNSSNFQQQNQHNYVNQLDNSQTQGQMQNQMYSGDLGIGASQTNIRRNSKQVSESGRPMLGSINQTSIDHFDHYKRPPSRDSSVDRYTRAASRLGGTGSRQPSVDRQIGNTNSIGMGQSLSIEVPVDRNVRAGSQFRGTTPAPNGSVMTGMGLSNNGPASRRGSRSGTPGPVPVYQVPMMPQVHYSTPNQPFEDVLLRQRNLGQDIIPSPGQPKRTESLYVPVKPSPSGGGGGGGKGQKVKHFYTLIHSNNLKITQNTFQTSFLEFINS